MRKVILQMYMTLDGFIAGPNGEQDWIFNVADEECGKYADELINTADIILLGRGLAKVFLDYWPTDTSEFAQKINKLPKIVFSKTLKKVEWPNVRLIKENIAEEIAKIKQQPGKNLILYGGANIVQTFMKLDLIDEYHIFVAPIVLGSGLSLFKIDEKINLKLVKSKSSNSGVVMLHYQPKSKEKSL